MITVMPDKCYDNCSMQLLQRIALTQSLKSAKKFNKLEAETTSMH